MFVQQVVYFTWSSAKVLHIFLILFNDISDILVFIYKTKFLPLKHLMILFERRVFKINIIKIFQNAEMFI